MIKEVYTYKKALSNLSSAIEESPLKTKYIYETLKMTPPTFYRKLKNKSFTPDEFIEIAKIIKPDEYIDYMLEKSEQDYKEGRTYTHKEVMEFLRKKHL